MNAPVHKDRRERPHPIGELTDETPPTVQQRYEAWWQRFKVAPNEYGTRSYDYFEETQR